MVLKGRQTMGEIICGNIDTPRAVGHEAIRSAGPLPLAPQLFVTGWRGRAPLLFPTEIGLALLDGTDLHHVPLDRETVAKLASFDVIEVIDPSALEQGPAARATWLLRPGERRNTIFH